MAEYGILSLENIIISIWIAEEAAKGMFMNNKDQNSSQTERLPFGGLFEYPH